MKEFVGMVLGVLLLTGCGTPLPDQVIEDLSVYIPEVRQKQMYPVDCQWGELKAVVDGDTIRVWVGGSEIKVRLVGVDAPETHHPTIGAEPYGQESTDFLRAEISKRVCLLDSSTGDLYDQYDRKLAYVFDDQGRDLNELIIATGLAEHYRKFSYDRKAEYQAAEELARKNRLAIWE